MLKSKLELKVPVISRNLVLKKTLSFQPDSRGKWTSNYEGARAMTPLTTNVDKPAFR